jgi:hypothetical protein
MLAYHNDPAIKFKLLADLQAHADADHIVKGQYWDNGKGCAVGCTLQSMNSANDDYDQHVEYETLLGIPRMLARLEDTIFEGLPNVEAKQWPMRFAAAIAPGADLSRVGWKWLHWLLTDGLPRVNNAAVTAAIAQSAEVLLPLTRGEPAASAAAAAAAVADAAAAAAAAVADAAAAAAAAVADADAAAPACAADAAAAAACAADAAAAAAYAAAAACAAAAAAAACAADAAGYAAYSHMAEKLIELLEAAT